MAVIATSRKYTYVRDDKWRHEAVDMHHIIVRKSATVKGFLLKCLSAFLLLSSGFFMFRMKDKPAGGIPLSVLLSAVVVKLLFWKPIKKESVVVFPAFGVQLEAHYGSGRIARRFVPISRILKPVLVECVTPVTCYWSLSLILREEEDMLLVFKELRPPVKMLVPIWKALSAAISTMDSSYSLEKAATGIE